MSDESKAASKARMAHDLIGQYQARVQVSELAQASLLCESRKRRPRAAAMRYSDWLRIADLGVTFHQYLTEPRFKERRDGCSHNAPKSSRRDEEQPKHKKP